MRNKIGCQIDISVLDFSKAFDTVLMMISLVNSSATAEMIKFGYGFIIFKKKANKVS